MKVFQSLKEAFYKKVVKGLIERLDKREISPEIETILFREIMKSPLGVRKLEEIEDDVGDEVEWKIREGLEESVIEPVLEIVGVSLENLPPQTRWEVQYFLNNRLILYNLTT